MHWQALISIAISCKILLLISNSKYVLWKRRWNSQNLVCQKTIYLIFIIICCKNTWLQIRRSRTAFPQLTLLPVWWRFLRRAPTAVLCSSPINKGGLSHKAATILLTLFLQLSLLPSHFLRSILKVPSLYSSTMALLILFVRFESGKVSVSIDVMHYLHYLTFLQPYCIEYWS